jgi:hypothetical protein
MELSHFRVKPGVTAFRRVAPLSDRKAGGGAPLESWRDHCSLGTDLNVHVIAIKSRDDSVAIGQRSKHIKPRTHLSS